MTVSGLSEIEVIPFSTRKRVNSPPDFWARYHDPIKNARRNARVGIRGMFSNLKNYKIERSSVIMAALSFILRQLSRQFSEL